MAEQSNTEMTETGEVAAVPGISPEPELSSEAEPSPDSRPAAGSERGRPTGAGRERGREGGREVGGFRIRLSENEQRAAQLVQESFQLRSTVAALGFSIRTVAQLLEQGKLDELVVQQRAQGGGRPEVSRDPSREATPVRRLERGERRGDTRGETRGDARGGERRGGRPDPFARPRRSQPAPPEPLPLDDTPLVEVAPLLDPALLDQGLGDQAVAEEPILPVTIEPQP